MNDLPERHVVTCFLRHHSDVLLLRRGDAAAAYPSRWDGVSGPASADPDENAARQKIDEATGLAAACTHVRRGALITAEDAALGTCWVVHPHLFDCARRAVRLGRTWAEAAWTSPTEMMRRPTAPELWAAYAQVAPSVASIRADRTRDAALLSRRALEVLRDWAGRLAWQEGKQRLTPERAQATLHALAEQLQQARPDAPLVHRRVEHVLGEWNAGSAAEMEQAARRIIARALEEDDAAT